MPLSARPEGTSPSGSYAIQSTKGVVAKVWWPFPTLMATEVSGYLDAAAARFIAESLRQHASEPTRIIGFHDWANVFDYASEARIILTNAARESMKRSDGIHVLAPSPLVRFGLRAANVILGDVYSYSERDPYDAALATALRKRGG